MSHTLSEFVDLFAAGLTAADRRRPQSGKYKPGIGPHPEDHAVDLTVQEIRALRWEWRIKLQQSYPGGSGQKCDLVWGDPPEWAIEIKMSRPYHNTGKPDPTAVKDILSPFASNGSALSDCSKLAESDIAPHRSILIYGFNDAERPLRDMITAFETLARTRVSLGDRHEAPIGPLVHPVHQTGAVFAWEVAPMRA